MTIKEIPVGSVFHIVKNDGYPKLRVEGGYVCLRDEIRIPESRFYPTNDAVLSSRYAVADYFLERFRIPKHETESIIERLGRTVF